MCCLGFRSEYNDKSYHDDHENKQQNNSANLAHVYDSKKTYRLFTVKEQAFIAQSLFFG